MKHLKTEAIILDSVDVFDADRFLILFSREAGKLRVRARGVRKPTSRLTGHLLSYVPTTVELVEGRSGYIVSSAQARSGGEREGVYPENSLLFMQQASVLAECINRIFTEGEPHPTIYDGLLHTLDRLRAVCETASGKARLVVGEFLLKCMVELGYEPQLAHCVLTGRPVEADSFVWSSQAGGIVSKEGMAQLGGTSYRPVASPQAIVALRQFVRPQFVAERLGMPAEVEEEALSLIYDYVQTQLGYPLKSLGIRRSSPFS